MMFRRQIAPQNCIARSTRFTCLTKNPASWRGFMNSRRRALLHPRHVARLRAFLAIDNLELDLVTFLQALVAFDVDRAVVHEHVRTTILTAYESKAFRVIEPLYGSFQSHVLLPPGRAHQHPHPEDAGLELRQSG